MKLTTGTPRSRRPSLRDGIGCEIQRVAVDAGAGELADSDLLRWLMVVDGLPRIRALAGVLNQDVNWVLNGAQTPEMARFYLAPGTITNIEKETHLLLEPWKLFQVPGRPPLVLDCLRKVVEAAQSLVRPGHEVSLRAEGCRLLACVPSMASERLLERLASDADETVRAAAHSALQDVRRARQDPFSVISAF